MKMESIAYTSNTRKRERRSIHNTIQHVQSTPTDRLYSVEDFIDKLEQAVLDRL